MANPKTMGYQKHKSPLSLLFIFLSLNLLLLLSYHTTTLANAGKVHIPDDLDDVVDDEEDDEWRNWAQKKKADPSSQSDLNPSDLDKMELSQIQAEMMKRQVGPLFGFVKLRLGVSRTPDEVSKMAMKWTKVLKTGGVEVKFMGVDLSTIMFTMEGGRDMDELKEFILEQPDAYEVKIGDNVHRRPGDPPVEEVIETLRKKKEETNDQSVGERNKDEL